jgi:hypothetical protein
MIPFVWYAVTAVTDVEAAPKIRECSRWADPRFVWAFRMVMAKALGLLALMLLHEARRPTRVDAAGDRRTHHGQELGRHGLEDLEVRRDASPGGSVACEDRGPRTEGRRIIQGARVDRE